MRQGFEGRVENFDGHELVGWIRFDPSNSPELLIEIVGWGCHKFNNIYPRADLVESLGEASGGFRIVLDELFPEIKELASSSYGVHHHLVLSAQHRDASRISFFEFVGPLGLSDGASSRRVKVDGRVDTLDEKWISGWAMVNDFQQLEVEILEGERNLGTTLTGLFRADVAERHPSAKYGGFITATPRLLCDGFPHTISVKLKSGWVFPGFPREVRLGKLIGIVERIDRHSVEGWFGFLRSADLAPKMLTIALNGDDVGVTNLRAPRQDVVVAGLAAEAYAFRFETQRGIFAEDVISISDRSTGYLLKIAETVETKNLPSAIVGHLDQISDSEIVGWAVDRRAPANPLRVIAFSNGTPVAEAITEGFRADVQRMFPQSLRPGFTIRTPSELRDGKPHTVELRVANTSRILSGTPTITNLSRRPRVFRNRPVSDLNALKKRIQQHIGRTSTVSKYGATKGVSHIILNRNGGDVFVRCLESLLRYIDFGQDELIVVDHASNDVSRDALALLESARLVSVIWKDRNDSFSKSNNDASAIATKPILLLLNNDIEFVGGISRVIEQHLASVEVGAVGIKLFDIVDTSSEEFAPSGVRELRIQHLGVWFHPGHPGNDFNLMGYDITTVSGHRDMFGVHDVAVVTGAALGIRTEDFLALGGFDEEFFYGTEDIDLCLRVRRTGKRIICDRNLAALHVRGYTRFTHRGGGASDRFAKNNRYLWEKCGASMRRDYLRSRVSRDGIYAPPAFRIGFAVTDAGVNTLAGDYFTALELAKALAMHHGVEYLFLSEREDWYDCASVDAVVVMRHDYDLRRTRNAQPHCLFLGWARNHFDTWLKQPWMTSFDSIFSSSKLFSYLLYRSLGIRAQTFYIATSFRSRPSEKIHIEHDVLFVGSRWGGRREVDVALQPERINGSVRVYGAGFDEVPSLRSVWGGLLPYSEVEARYHRSRIVVDDANATTKRWGSPNSRVFDAIAAGAVILTNSTATGAVLGNTLPVWTNATDLTQQINYLLENEEQLTKQAAAQIAVVRESHTYKARAETFLDVLDKHAAHNLRIDILTAVPALADAALWGDWHFAVSLAHALRKLGHSVRVRKLAEKSDRATDVILGLRGLQRFQPVVGAVNILWIISHPDLVAGDELKGWQHVFVASQTLADRLKRYNRSLSILEQATGFTPSSLRVARIAGQTDVRNNGVFVGNTRGVSRAFINMSAEAGLEFDIWGDGWKGTPLESRVRASSIENKRLGQLYAGAAFVLSDHWPDMANDGIVSNRIFDALAAGGVVISDPVEGIENLRLPNLFVCRTPAEIKDAYREAQNINYEARLEGARSVTQRYSFGCRARLIIARVMRLLEQPLFELDTSYSTAL